jgi:ribosomal protein L16 Arg81 hydroxylase
MSTNDREHPWFSRLIAPLTERQFLENYWLRAPVYIQGPPRKFEDLAFRVEGFLEVLWRLEATQLKAQLVAPGGECRNIAIAASQARYCFDAGMTLCASGVDCRHENLRSLARATKRGLKVRGNVFFNCYFSPEGTGFAMHFDAQSVFILQMEGTKRWHFSARPALESPPANLDAEPQAIQRYRAQYCGDTLEEPKSMRFHEQLLYPGDLLYLPAGTWHRAFAGAYALGLSLTCCVNASEQRLFFMGKRRSESYET